MKYIEIEDYRTLFGTGRMRPYGRAVYTHFSIRNRMVHT